MQVSANHTPSIYTNQTPKNKTPSDSKFIEQVDPNTDKEIIEPQEDEIDYALEQFKESLRTKGALKFLMDFNLEKIEEKVKEYKEKLLKEMGDSPENLAEIEKMVEDYRKKLLEEMQEKTAKEKEDQKGTLVFSVQSFVKMLLEKGTNKETSPLKDILQRQ